MSDGLPRRRSPPWRALLPLALALLALLPAPPVAAQTLRLLFAGDIMLDDGPGRTIAAGGDPLAAFDELLRAADFRIGNLECPVAASGTPLDNKIFSFRADPAAMRVLRGRFDVLSVANNHSGDQGQAAFLETLRHVEAAGIRAAGGGANLAAAHRPVWLEKQGLRIALLAYNEFKPRRFEAGPDWPGIAWSEDSRVVADIRAARAAGADLVIPFMHWGWERESAPSDRQHRLARLMIDAGADAVVGAHPHVVQGHDQYRGKPIFWSLGNFVFDGFDPGPGRLGWLLLLEAGRGGVHGWEIVEAVIDGDGTPRPGARQKSMPAGRRP